MNCSLWVRGSYEGNQKPRRIALELPYGRPCNYLIEYALYEFTEFHIGYPTGYL